MIHHLRDLDDRCRGGALAIGNFDGVHRGHAEIVAVVCEQAARHHGPAVILTFDPHPARLLRPEEAPPPLTWPERKAELLGELGIDVLVAFPTTLEILGLGPGEFFQSVVVDQLQAKALVEGPNFYFGRDRTGNIETLGRLCRENDITLDIVAPLMEGEEYISSSRIRAAIRMGDVEAAARMLTHPYRIRGMVTHGARRGTGLGFPTANLDAVDTLVPGEGVYAGQAVVDARTYRAAIHIGPNPTFQDAAKKVEVHLLDFGDSIYGEPLEVQFERRLRDIRKFGSQDELKSQLANDIASARV